MPVETESMPEPQVEQRPSLLEEIRVEAGAFWRHMPNKGLFFGLLGIWLAFFHFLGNSVFGYIDTPSLLRWMYYQYNTSEDDGHGLLLPFVVVALLYWKRAQLMAIPKDLWWPGVVLVGLCLLLHTIGYALQFPQVSVVAFYAGIYALTGVAWGWRWLIASFFPMFIFGFGVPLGTLSEFVTFPLRILATIITVVVCKVILGIDVAREGTQLVEAGGRFKYDVGVACAGMRSLISLLGIATVYAFVTFRAHWRKLLMIGSALPLAVAGNVFRLVCIVVAAEAFGHDAGKFVHDRLGLLPYIPAIAGMLLMGKLLQEQAEARKEAQRG